MPVWQCGRSPREAAVRGRAQNARRHPGRCPVHATLPNPGPGRPMSIPWGCRHGRGMRIPQVSRPTRVPTDRIPTDRGPTRRLLRRARRTRRPRGRRLIPRRLQRPRRIRRLLRGRRDIRRLLGRARRTRRLPGYRPIRRLPGGGLAIPRAGRAGRAGRTTPIPPSRRPGRVMHVGVAHGRRQARAGNGRDLC